MLLLLPLSLLLLLLSLSLLLLLFSWFMPSYHVSGLLAGIFGSLVIMLVNWLIWAVLGPKQAKA